MNEIEQPDQSPADTAAIDLAAHFQKYLGPIERGWTHPILPGVTAAVFEDAAFPADRTIATLGLSQHVLDLPRSRRVRLEFLLAATPSHDAGPLADALLQFALSFLPSARAPLRGEVFGPGPEIAPGTGKTCFYVTVPTIFPDELAQISGTEPDTVSIWAVPVSENEAAFVRRVGWSAFEDALVMQNPPLADLARPDIAMAEDFQAPNA